MLTSDQINELHRLYLSEQWPIRKIERHLNMGWKTIKKYLDAPAQEQLLAGARASSTRLKQSSRSAWRKILLSPPH